MRIEKRELNEKLEGLIEKEYLKDENKKQNQIECNFKNYFKMVLLFLFVKIKIDIKCISK